MSLTTDPGPIRRPLHHSVLVRAGLLIAACCTVIVALMATRDAASTGQTARDFTENRGALVTELLAADAGAALHFGKPEALDQMMTTLLDQSNGIISGIGLFDADGQQLGLRGTADPAMAEAARQALASPGTLVSLPENELHALTTTFGKDHALAGAVVVDTTVDRALAQVAEAQLYAYLIGGGLLLVTLLVTIPTFRVMISRPLLQVGEAMRAVAAGDLAADVPHRARRDEIGSIAGSLEQLRGSLQAAEVGVRDGRYKGAAFEASAAAMMLCDPALRLRYANGAMGQMMATLAPQIRGRVPGFDPKALADLSLDQLQTAGGGAPLRPGQMTLPARTELRFGATTIEMELNSVTDPEGALIGYVAEWRDVTEQMRSAAVLAGIDAAQLRAELDAEGRLHAANDRFATALGQTLQSLRDQGFADRISLAGGSPGALMQQLREGRTISGQLSIRRQDGRETLVQGSFTGVRNSTGQLRSLVLIGTDITDSEAERIRAEARRSEMVAAQEHVVDALRLGLERLAQGDLSAQIDSAFDADYETLRGYFNAATEQLSAAIQGVVDNAEAIRGEAREISSAADDLSRRTEQQAATLEQTAAALDQLTSSVRSAADVAGQANRMVEQAKSNAETSGKVVREAVVAMGEIEESSGKISRITGVIDEIAFQTNLLALNAGVEAARAGEAGRGFAVVASEVRALAQRSSDAAREIAGLISASSHQVKRGVDLVGQAGEALTGIQTSVTEIYSCVADIAASAREQSAGLGEINTAVNQLDQVTQQNAAMFEETTAASHSLNREAETLTSTMAQFSTGRGVAPPAARSPAPAPAYRAPAAKPAPASAAPTSPAPARRLTSLAVKPDPTSDWEEF
ncbi:methyl-accepting chemotaxis protein [Frigidibacter sp. MR17.24]|uniref:methyl-accepting chemotaxis protein n=1 Tax=Frigidibacter sp. MR17.24 TaxID=3127345 RepID=UPI00301313E8